jgi:hypothetical protein
LGKESEAELVPEPFDCFSPCGSAAVNGVIWNVWAFNSEVKNQDSRLDQFEKRPDGIEAKLDILIRRAEPMVKGE